MDISFTEHTSKTALPKAKSERSAWVIFVADEGKLSPLGKDWDKQTGGALKTAITAGKFTGKRGHFASIIAPSGLPTPRVILMGNGKDFKLNLLGAQNMGGKLVAHLNSIGVAHATLFLEGAENAAHVAYGARLRSYRFDKYRTKEKPEDKPTLVSLTIATDGANKAQKELSVLDGIAESIFFTRDLVSEPANVIYPESLAAKAKELTKLGVKVEVLGESQMQKLGMWSLLGVGQGSERESQLVVMQWNGNPGSKTQPISFVGKGVTFDTGGISIKPANGMEEMKWDMGGAGTVIGLMRALASRKAKVNAIGVVGLVENMPDGNAQRPGDVVTSMSGQTIEVINTDAEGRLVLADALWYTHTKFNPQTIIDLATLTGAIIVGLGFTRAGLFSNNDALARQLFESGNKTGELVWRMPLGDSYDKLINSDIADMKNVGDGKGAGSITAAQFLKRFIKDIPWAHLDIAGTAWSNKDQDTCPKGASGFGIRLLNDWVATNHEGK